MDKAQAGFDGFSYRQVAHLLGGLIQDVANAEFVDMPARPKVQDLAFILSDEEIILHRMPQRIPAARR